ncbi:DUF4372 domain-containing protein [Flavobacterium sp. W20_MBD1_R3]|uniref:DUF4372 domain-containing protein n=1 Tax=Flavobacterium sp. W20_MBD1_R3 TaxID=3240278 RepID=UPI003F924DD1
MVLFRPSKYTKKPVIRQIIDLGPCWMLEFCAKQHKSYTGCPKCKTYDQFVDLSYGQLNKRYTLGDISAVIRVSETFIKYLG